VRRHRSRLHAYARRKFFELYKANQSPAAAWLNDTLEIAFLGRTAD
jgi:hypothetical protein